MVVAASLKSGESDHLDLEDLFGAPGMIFSSFSQKTGYGTVGGGESIELHASDPLRPLFRDPRQIDHLA